MQPPEQVILNLYLRIHNNNLKKVLKIHNNLNNQKNNKNNHLNKKII